MSIFSTTKLVLTKNAPYILTGIGIAGMLGSTILACRATLKSQEVIKEYKKTRGAIEMCIDLVNNPDSNVTEADFSKEDCIKDKTRLYVGTALELTKLYAPALALGAVSVFLIGKGQTIQAKRVAALGAAYTALQEGWDQYRARIREELGEDKEREIHQAGIQTVKETVDGLEIDKIDVSKVSPYAVAFDRHNPNWNPDNGMNSVFLRAVQNSANDLLKSRGHLFLNEVYDELGFQHTTLGALVGWVFDPSDADAQRDNYVDFDLLSDENQNVLTYGNGTDGTIMLDFNVDGVIYDLI